MTDVMIEAYLNRLECPGATEVTRENLFLIQEAHFRHIPYENIDIFNGAGMTPLDPDFLFDKIVLGHRGGYCFELNGLLGELLRTLGYHVTEYFARWLFGEAESVPMRRHRVLKVTAGGENFIVDAGVGCLCPLQPLNFRLNEEQERNGRVYRIVRDPALGCVVQTMLPDKGFVNFYSFAEDPHYPQDFIYVHYFCSNADDSVFRARPMAHIYTEHGRKWLEELPDNNGTVLRIQQPDGSVSELKISGKRDLEKTLKREFGIDVSIR